MVERSTDQPSSPVVSVADEPDAPPDDAVRVTGRATESAMDSISNIVNSVAEQTAARIRDEIRARDVPTKVKQAGLGVGALGAAGVLGIGAAGALMTAFIAALSRRMPVWAASLVGAGVFGGTAAALAAAGQRQVREPLGLTQSPSS